MKYISDKQKKQIETLKNAWNDNRDERMPAWLFQQKYKREIMFPDFVDAIGKATLKDALKTLVLTN
jgi:hypothetical protein